MQDVPLFLASSSPRRRALLARAGIIFEPFVVPVDEEALTEAYSGPLERLGEFLAREKAIAARDALTSEGKHGMVLAADTTVLLDGRSIPEPADVQEAERMLTTLRGREHVVATGVALAPPAPGQLVSSSSATRVLMRDYGDEEIAAYVATGDPLDKAGAYSIQHPGFTPVEGIAGCHLGVIGLPICIVARMLGRGALPPLAPALTPGGTRCVWSPQCTPPLPTEATLDLGATGEGFG